MQGAYFVRALDATVGNMFRKGHDLAEYPQKPATYVETERQKEIRAEKEAEAERVRLVNYLNGVINTMSKNANKEQ